MITAADVIVVGAGLLRSGERAAAEVLASVE